MEQVAGIEPVQPAWEASVLPLNYTCVFFIITRRLIARNPLFSYLCFQE